MGRHGYKHGECSNRAREANPVTLLIWACKISGMESVTGDRTKRFSRLGGGKDSYPCERYAGACIPAVFMRGVDQLKGQTDLVRQSFPDWIRRLIISTFCVDYLRDTATVLRRINLSSIAVAGRRILSLLCWPMMDKNGPG